MATNINLTSFLLLYFVIAGNNNENSESSINIQQKRPESIST